MIDAEIHKSLAVTIKNWCAEQDNRRRIEQAIVNHTSSINWLKKELATKKLSQANIAEYNYQIKYHELNITFLQDNK